MSHDIFELERVLQEMDSENKDNKSAAPELPPGARWSECGPHVYRVAWAAMSPLRDDYIENEDRTLAANAAWRTWSSFSCISRVGWAHAQECVRRLPEVEARVEALLHADRESSRARGEELEESAELRARAERAEKERDAMERRVVELIGSPPIHVELAELTKDLLACLRWGYPSRPQQGGFE